MENMLILVKLNDEQVALAKEVNGSRKQITHALLCGEYGQMFGTEKQCSKYFNVWKGIFKTLFFDIKLCNSYHVSDYENTFNLVNILITASDKQKTLGASTNNEITKQLEPTSKKGFWSRIFG